MKQILYTFAFALFLMPAMAFAAAPNAGMLPSEVTDQTSAFAGGDGAAFTVTADPRLVVASVIQVVVSLLGTVFLIYGIWGGFQIFTSQGNEDQIKRAKSTIITAGVGIMVMLVSYSFTLFITRSVQRAVGIDPRYTDDGEWNVRIEIDAENNVNPDPLSSPPRPGRIIR